MKVQTEIATKKLETAARKALRAARSKKHPVYRSEHTAGVVYNKREKGPFRTGVALFVAAYPYSDELLVDRPETGGLWYENARLSQPKTPAFGRVYKTEAGWFVAEICVYSEPEDKYGDVPVGYVITTPPKRRMKEAIAFGDALVRTHDLELTEPWSKDC